MLKFAFMRSGHDQNKTAHYILYHNITFIRNWNSDRNWIVLEQNWPKKLKFWKMCLFLNTTFYQFDQLGLLVLYMWYLCCCADMLNHIKPQNVPPILIPYLGKKEQSEELHRSCQRGKFVVAKREKSERRANRTWHSHCFVTFVSVFMIQCY